MSAPHRDDSAFRYTEDSQSSIHYLGSRLRDITPGAAQRVYRWESEDLTTLRRVSTSVGVPEVSATIRVDGQPQSLLNMLAAGERGATLEYFPSLSNPSESYPCVLMDSGGLQLTPDPDRWWERRYSAKVRLRRIDGGSFQGLLEGTFFYWTGGNSLFGETFTRTGATGTYVDEDGVLQTAAANIRRTEWLDLDGDGIRETVAALLEKGTTNEFFPSENLNDGVRWIKTALAGITVDQEVGPDGQTSLDAIVEDSTLGAHFVNQAVTGMTADATYALSGWFIAGTRDFVRLLMEETGTPANFVQAWFDLVTGAVGTTTDNGTGTFVRAYTEDWTDTVAGLYRCVLVGSIGNSATAITGSIRMATQDAETSYQGDGSSRIFGGYMQLEDAAVVATSYVATTTAAASRDDDLLTATIGFTPADIVAAGGATFYSRWEERGTVFDAAVSARHWQVGDITDGLLLRSNAVNSGDMEAVFAIGAAQKVSNTPAGTFSLKDVIETRVTVEKVSGSWQIQLHYSIDGAAEVSVTAAAIGANLPAAWGAQTAAINSAVNGTSAGIAAHIAHKFLRGVKTLAECQAA